MGKEIINGPFDVYAAAVGTVYEDIATTPIVGWTKIGTNSNRHYGEEGVVMNATQEFTKHSFAGGTEVLKISRILEECMINFTLFDLASAEWAKAFNLSGTTVTDTAAASGTGGHQSWGILRGLAVQAMALLIRGENKSPDLVTENVQIEIPAAVQIANLETVYNKADNAGVAFSLQAIADYDYESAAFPYGRILVGDEVPS